LCKKKYYITCTCFDKRGRVISVGTNSYSESSAMMRYYAVKSGNPEKKFNHAEIDAAWKCIKAKKTVAKMLILRYNSQGQFANACPCEVCKCMIEDLGIKHVYYSTSEGIVKL